jgi:probable F420-dependent oxidoreductase
MVTANVMWDLQEASRGRFVLGLGSQVKGHNERRFSVPWSPPAPRMQDYVQALRAIWRAWARGEKLDYRGRHYSFSLMTPNFIPEGSGQLMSPITIAAVGPAMLRVAGRVCDGARLHPFCTRRYAEEAALPRIQEGLVESGRRRENFEISGGGFIATGPDDEAVQRMVEWVRYRIGFYGSTRTYWPVLEAHGLHDLGAKLHRHSLAGRWDKLAGEVSDETVHLFAAVGRYDQLVAAIDTRFGGLSDTISTNSMPGIRPGLLSELVDDIKRLPRRFVDFKTEAP